MKEQKPLPCIFCKKISSGFINAIGDKICWSCNETLDDETRQKYQKQCEERMDAKFSAIETPIGEQMEMEIEE